MQETPITPRVTALILSRDAAPALRKCLGALVASNNPELLEIVVVDDGSRDESQTLDTEFPAAQFLRLPKQFGATRALNIGIRTAKGEYIFLLRPEIAVHPDTINALVNRMEAVEGAGAVCPFIQRTYTLPDAAVLKEVWKTDEFPSPIPIDPQADEVSVEFPHGAPILVRRAFLAGMHYFDEKFGEFGPELELCFQLRSSGRKILVLPQVKVDRNPVARNPDNAITMADRAIGAGVYIGKRFGTGAALTFRLGAILSALGSFQFGLLANLVAGQKIDGNQSNA
jgi:GT2 family glycosyltransferase